MNDEGTAQPAAPAPVPSRAREPRLSISLARAFERALIAGFALAPVPVIAYLALQAEPAALFLSHAAHEIAIAVAIGVSATVTAISWRCYVHRGEPMLRWLTLSLLAMTLIYAPHGILTPLAAHNPPMFLLYGPTSRFAMAALLLVSLIKAGQTPEPPKLRGRASLWWPWIGLFLAVDLLVAAVAADRSMPHGNIRVVLESGAIMLNLSCLAVLLRNRPLSPLLLFFGLGVAFFVQSSASFFLARPWNHQWWLAHGVFASGFLLVSFGIIRAFLTTRSLVTVFSAEQLMQQTLAANARAHRALHALHESNRKLELLATTDSLTGLTNRRHFMERLGEELRRARRQQRPVSLIAIDLDHFKQINDGHGHAAGDRVLQVFSALVNDELRPADLAGRLGGEEFAIMLPETPLEGACLYAERIRHTLASTPIDVTDTTVLRVSASIGISTSPADGDAVEALLGIADERLYAAKKAGRNRVCAA